MKWAALLGILIILSALKFIPVGNYVTYGCTAAAKTQKLSLVRGGTAKLQQIEEADQDLRDQIDTQKQKGMPTTNCPAQKHYQLFIL
jgi:hypothetical protein